VCVCVRMRARVCVCVCVFRLVSLSSPGLWVRVIDVLKTVLNVAANTRSSAVLATCSANLPAWLMTWLTRASDNGWLLCGICDDVVSAALLNWCTVPISHATYTKITGDGRQHCSWHSENEVPSTVTFHFVHCQSIGLIYFTSEEHLPISLDTYNSYSWNSTVQYLVTLISSRNGPGFSTTVTRDARIVIGQTARIKI
jgi:hypothetical protein